MIFVHWPAEAAIPVVHQAALCWPGAGPAAVWPLITFTGTSIICPLKVDMVQRVFCQQCQSVHNVKANHHRPLRPPRQTVHHHYTNTPLLSMCQHCAKAQYRPVSD